MVTKMSDSLMYTQISSLPEQIERALLANFNVPPKSKMVCVCGMGASALAGDVLSDYVDCSADAPLYVVRGIELPGWVGKDSTVIALSYSGNTKETLIVYEEARSRGCQVICMTSGGSLAKACRSNQDTLVELPRGMQSRGAFGYLLGYLANALEKMGVCNAATELGSLIPELKRQRNELADDNNTTVMDIARPFLNKVPVVYSLADMRSSAIRWKTQINENSKFISFCGSLPEFNHNEIVGWSVDSKNSMFTPVILYDDDASAIIKHMTDTSIGILQDNGLNPMFYHVKGSSNIEKNLKCILLGDFVSLQLAYLRRTDPVIDTPVEDTNDLVITDD